MDDTELSQKVLTFKYRLLPSKRQRKRLDQILEEQRELYNAALESKIDCHRKNGGTLSCFDLFKQLTELRRDSEYAVLPVSLQRATIKRLDASFRAFFRRVKRGDKPGFPRFKGNGSWNSFGFDEFSGIRFDGKRVRFRGLHSSLRVHVHRQMPSGEIISCQFKRELNVWHVCFQVRFVSKVLPATGKAVGVDLGLSSLAVLSTGEHIKNPRIGQRNERELRRRQRHMSRCKRGSKGRQKARENVARLHMKMRNTRRTFLHQVSANLIRENDLIAIEKLNVKGMASGMLAKSVNDAGWSILKEMLAYKAARAGRELIEVDARDTTQACSGCGVIVPKKLADRWHDCPECGLSLDRDHNAAINILGRSGSKAA